MCVKEIALEANGNGSVNFVIVHFNCTKDINFIFFSSNFQFFYFHRRVMGSHILHSSIGFKG